MSRKYGYARVSTQDQNLDLQIAALQKVDCDKIYADKGVSGAKESRPGLNRLLNNLKPGDTLVVWRLDRLGRSLRYLVSMIETLGKNSIHFISLTENIDTSSSGGKLLFHMMAALAEFERTLISERTRAGMATARANGRHIGKRRALTPEQQREALQALCDQVSVKDVAQRYAVHPRTIQRLKTESMAQAH
ncbi:recombinase family protein [Paracandidimonas soli]|uniref:recombinase family protein n=1 Tax=Paracandidimonas soli TaxID=1917182 RepID=UPI003340CC30